jgi:hypothetical protein
MFTKLPASDLLNREFLEMRCRVIDLAASLDRIHKATDVDANRTDPRLHQLTDGLRILLDGQGDRTARVQMLFSDPYESDWR